MSSSTISPKLFISYSWSNPEHEEWVLQLAKQLREGNGVDVILDKWDLKKGNDSYAFMEKMVSDEEVRKVILIIDKIYNEKANKRSGGVGSEAQIISAEIYESVEQDKFVAVIAEKDEEGNIKVPTFYKGRIHIDLSDEAIYAEEFEQLLRWIYDQPLHIKPELGNKPAYLDEELSISMGTSSYVRRFVEAIKNSRPHANGALVDYFNLFSVQLNKFRLDPSNGAENFDQKVMDSIEQFTPFRNELIQVFSAIGKYDQTGDYKSKIHKFFESLIPYLDRPEEVKSYHPWDWDNLKFIIQECFLLSIAIFLRYERYDIVEYLLKQRYFIKKDSQDNKSKMCSFDIFNSHLYALDHRNTRLKFNQVSLHANLIKERCTDSGVSFEEITQADFLLYLAACLQSLKKNNDVNWWPHTLTFKIYHGGSFEIFLRAESTEYFKWVASILDINSKSDLIPFYEAVENRTHVPSWCYQKLNPVEMTNYDRLCSHD